MVLAPFDYARPETIDAAADALADGRGQVLAGGQSLVAAMNLGRQSPVRLVDINQIPELTEVTYAADRIIIGATVRLAELRESPRLLREAPLLYAALRHVAHVQIRTRATLGGNLSQADPCSELPAVMVALGATATLRSQQGERDVAMADYIVGPYRTSGDQTELLTRVTVPLPSGAAAGFYEIARKAKDWPVIGAGAQVRVNADGFIDDAWVGACGLAGRPRKLIEVEQALRGKPADADALRSAASVATGAEEYPGARAGARYRERVLPVVVERALVTAVETTREQEHVA
ncbi:FAD binding domain-containing protein [Aeromicrobium piscarium]|uniref:Xanthine dehydrogenase family protein subunit M n=1 Tax=Aeromicrobium piscarium TaxID=2590901 RepID=A0A554SCZ2_9ACTN|nr:FAD binding domain-containing protein [Aeromicrobium piscarium]TSD64203.1 xanthine dehydrogenase family protein subunit M [Aeromicrobium piscarium]